MTGVAMGGIGEDSVDEQISFLKKSEIFSPLSTEELRMIMDRGRMETYTPGSIIFNIGDPADAVYVVKAGVVEICRGRGESGKMPVVAYLGESDPIGETAIITGSSRASVARVPEKLEILKIDKARFMDLLREIPELSLSLLTILAKRLERGFKKERVAARYRQLSGKLEYFDLPTIIQTLANSSLTGTLTVTDVSGRIFAMLYFEAGFVLYAKLGHLRGKQAFYQLFQSAAQDGFSFKGGLPPKEFDGSPQIAMSPMALLLESARLQDELKVLKTHYPDPHRVFQPQSEALAWDHAETQTLAEEIWVHLKLGQSIAQMAKEIPTCEHHIYNVLSVMDAKGLVA
jgi:CRP/FNR family cyclic AMP-dependent transcriptional regulator